MNQNDRGAQGNHESLEGEQTEPAPESAPAKPSDLPPSQEDPNFQVLRAGMVPAYKNANLVDNVYRASSPSPSPPRPTQPAQKADLNSRPPEKKPWSGGQEPPPQSYPRPGASPASGPPASGASAVPPPQLEPDFRVLHAGTVPVYKKERADDSNRASPPPPPPRNFAPLIVVPFLLIGIVAIGSVVFFFASQVDFGKQSDTTSNTTPVGSASLAAETKSETGKVGTETGGSAVSEAEKAGTSSTGLESTGLEKIAKLIKAGSKSASTSAAKISDLSGSWSSEWGSVNITQKGSQITGDWSQGAPPSGTITGTYDNASGTMEVEYYQPWDKTRGKAKFQLQENGKTLVGKWTQDTGEQGTWNLSR